MEYVVDPIPVPTYIIRTSADGPKPANTLAFLECRASGADIAIDRTDLVRWQTQFKSQFRIDGYLQAKHDWYLANTFVSATGMLRLASTTTDFEFVIALDSIDPFIDLDGVLGFNCQFALQIDGLDLFETSAGLDAVWNVCAYVLLFEPQPDLPPSGGVSHQWRYDPRLAESQIRVADQHRVAVGRIAHLETTLISDRAEKRITSD
jgi:hypothetical protein